MRPFLKGEFRGRNVVILLQDGNEEPSVMLVAAMETRGRTDDGPYDFAGYEADSSS